MARRGDVSPHLTSKERQTLELAIQGMPVDQMAAAMNQSPKVVERYIHQALGKLEAWSRNAAPGPSHNSAYERELGFLRPREAERRIARIVRDVGEKWACVVLLGIPDNSKVSNSEEGIEAVSRHIHRSTRRSDIVMKWSATEWVIFLPWVTPEQADLVVHRLKHAQTSPWPIFIGSQYGGRDMAFPEVANRCHQELIAQYVHQDLAVWANPLSRAP